MSHPARSRVRALIACAAIAAACGGKVVFVEDDGTEPEGGAPGLPQGGAPSDGGSFSNPTGGDGGSIGVGVPVTPCQAACNTVFQCGLQPDSNGLVLCPGFQSSDQTTFVNGCVETCEEQMALLSIVDPDDCEATIETLETVNAPFADSCAFGF